MGVDKKKLDPEKAAENVEANISALSDTIAQLTEQLGPLMNFSDITKEVNNMKDMSTKPDSDSVGTEEVLIDSMFQLCEMYPNDTELGGKVRELYHKFHPDSDKT